MWKSGFFLHIGLAICGKSTKPRVHMQLFWEQSRIGPQTRFSKAKIDQNFGFLCRMVLEWREREHGDVEEAMQGDLMAQQALRACGLYKFWCLGSLRAKRRLL